MENNGEGMFEKIRWWKCPGELSVIITRPKALSTLLPQLTPMSRNPYFKLKPWQLYNSTETSA